VIDSPSAPSYDAWQTNVGSDDVTIDYKTYFFNVQNAEDVLKGAKPVVVQTGPYPYKEYFNKFDIEFKDGE
jgi:hypothetical protein